MENFSPMNSKWILAARGATTALAVLADAKELSNIIVVIVTLLENSIS